VANAGNALSLQLAQVTAKVLDQQINLAPIITVPSGSLINIRPTRDVFLREPIYPHDEEQQLGPKIKNGKKP
jgi:type IV secretion system protein VirB10